jgi:hypothetical protein
VLEEGCAHIGQVNSPHAEWRKAGIQQLIVFKLEMSYFALCIFAMTLEEISHGYFYYTSKPECAVPDDN